MVPTVPINVACIGGEDIHKSRQRVLLEPAGPRGLECTALSRLAILRTSRSKLVIVFGARPDGKKTGHVRRKLVRLRGSQASAEAAFGRSRVGDERVRFPQRVAPGVPLQFFGFFPGPRTGRILATWAARCRVQNRLRQPSAEVRKMTPGESFEDALLGGERAVVILAQRVDEQAVDGHQRESVIPIRPEHVARRQVPTFDLRRERLHGRAEVAPVDISVLLGPLEVPLVVHRLMEHVSLYSAPSGFVGSI